MVRNSGRTSAISKTVEGAREWKVFQLHFPVSDNDIFLNSVRTTSNSTPKFGTVTSHSKTLVLSDERSRNDKRVRSCE